MNGFNSRQHINYKYSYWLPMECCLLMLFINYKSITDCTIVCGIISLEFNLTGTPRSVKRFEISVMLRKEVDK